MPARSEALVDFRFIVHQLVLDANDTVELLFSISENFTYRETWNAIICIKESL
jgi:hypothetical protein